MTVLWAITRRELAGYFHTPLAYVFTVIYLVLSGVFTFYVGHFYERGQADLTAFFTFQPWLFLLLMPAISMRLWSEEYKSGSVELLLTLPLSAWQVTLGKFIAAWLFTGLALGLTFPLWFTVNYLGDPDNGVIVAAYLGSWLMAGAYLAIGVCVSATTHNQVIAFMVTVSLCGVFIAAGSPIILDFFTAWLDDEWWNTLASASFLVRFDAISKGVLDLGDLCFFVLMILLWLLASVAVIDSRRTV
jgi:ABC-2 type transport system permease protein